MPSAISSIAVPVGALLMSIPPCRSRGCERRRQVRNEGTARHASLAWRMVEVKGRPVIGAPHVDWIPGRAHGLPGRLGLTCAPGVWREGAQSDTGRQLQDDLRAMVQFHGAAVLVTLLE